MEKWDEEFEDTILVSKINTYGGIKGLLAFPIEKLWGLFLYNKNIKKLLDKYFKLVCGDDTCKNLETRVTIKVRRGAILIEEVKK